MKKHRDLIVPGLARIRIKENRSQLKLLVSATRREFVSMLLESGISLVWF
jgi:hypothetical protein